VVINVAMTKIPTATARGVLARVKQNSGGGSPEWTETRRS